VGRLPAGSLKLRQNALSMANKPRFRAATDAITLGIAFPACIVVGYFLGKGADRLFGSGPYGSYVGGALGIAAGFWNLYKISREADDEDRGGPP
jgi:F0F1-type ATP synthase assembly protein I